MAVALPLPIERWVLPTSQRVGVDIQRQIAYSASADRVWVLSAKDESIAVLDGASGQALGSISIPSAPQTCVFDNAAGLAYVPLLDDALVILDARSGALLKTVSLPAGCHPRNLMPLFARGRVYVLNYGQPATGKRGTVAVLDTRTCEIIKQIPAGFGLFNGKTGHDRIGKLYFNNRESESTFGPGEVTIVDDSTEDVVARIAVGRVPERLAHWPQRNQMYAANLADNTVSAIDIETDTVVATIPVGDSPYRLGAVESINGRDEMWVLCGGSWQLPRMPPQADGGQICVISGREQRVIRTIQVCDFPAFWAVSRGYCYVPSAYAREMSVVDIRGGGVVGSVKLGRDPVRATFEGIVWSTSGLMFLLNADGTVSVFSSA
jgi:YVTN family beta-propeller protein